MKLDADRVPADLDEAIAVIVAAMEPVDLAFARKHDHEATHFRLGTWLRNNWGLWEHETPLVQWFIANLELGHADDISGIILAGVWAQVRNLPFDPKVLAAQKQAQWRSCGCNPVTGESQ